jgi:sporulation protein YlmC with PRC-barrel domain
MDSDKPCDCGRRLRGAPRFGLDALASRVASKLATKEADMNMNVAYAALLGTALAGPAALAQQAGNPAQAPAPPSQAAETQSKGPAPTEGEFIAKQKIDEWRAPKLVGIDVYGADNKKIGKIADILMNHDGTAQTVVIGVGGFLGIGEKDIAVPFHSVQWRTEGRVLPTEIPTPPAAPLASSGGAQQPSAPPPPKKTDPAATEASQGYPDKAAINMTLAQLKSAPEFQYAQNPSAEAGEPSSQSAARPRPQPQQSKP